MLIIVFLIVMLQIVEGSDLLNERTDAEYRFLKKVNRFWKVF